MGSASLSERELAAVAAARGDEVFFSRKTVERGRADLRRRYGAPTFAEALRRHQMSEDEHAARIDAMERRFEQLNATIERALSGRGNGSNGEVERQTRRIEDDFTADELKMVRDHREYESFKRNVERYGAELEREAALAARDADDDDDEVDEDGDDDEGEQPKRAAKKQPAKRKPPARHSDDDDDPAGDGKPQGLLAKLMAD